jgi:hypothetical protein
MRQNKNTKIKAGTSSNSRKADPLDKYRAQARTFIGLYFGDDTPPFVRDLLSEWYGQLENKTQVFWNDQRIAEIAIPLMLKKADDMGIDVGTLHSCFMSDVVKSWSGSVGRNGDADTYEGMRSAEQLLTHEFERDAEAFARLIHSENVPVEIRNNLGDMLATYTAKFYDSPEALKVSYPLAMQKHWNEEGEEAVEGE